MTDTMEVALWMVEARRDGEEWQWMGTYPIRSHAVGFAKRAFRPGTEVRVVPLHRGDPEVVR